MTVWFRLLTVIVLDCDDGHQWIDSHSRLTCDENQSELFVPLNNRVINWPEWVAALSLIREPCEYNCLINVVYSSCEDRVQDNTFTT